jgi:hypothetical protein
MFKFGYKFYVIRRNNAIPFSHGGISASIISEQPQFIRSSCFEFRYSIFDVQLFNLGASSKPLNKSSANHIKFIPKQDGSYRNIIMITDMSSGKKKKGPDKARPLGNQSLLIFRKDHLLCLYSHRRLFF